MMELGQREVRKTSGKETAARATVAFTVRDVSLKFADGELVTNNRFKLRKPVPIDFIVTFQGQPTVTQFRMTLVVMQRIYPSSEGPSGGFHPNNHITSRCETVTVQGNPPSVFLRVPFHPVPPFHGGPGPYDSAITLTPMENGLLDDSESFGIIYDFEGVNEE